MADLGGAVDVAAYSYGNGRGLVRMDAGEARSIPWTEAGPVAVAACPADISGVFRADALRCLAENHPDGERGGYTVTEHGIESGDYTVPRASACGAIGRLADIASGDWTYGVASAAHFARCLDWTARAAPKRGVAHARGVRIEILASDRVRMVATDGRRMHVASVNRTCEEPVNVGDTVTAAGHILEESIRPILAGLKKQAADDTIRIGVRSDGWSVVVVGRVVVHMREKGRFPDWVSVVPKSAEQTAYGGCCAMDKALKTAKRFGSKDSDLLAVDLVGEKIDGHSVDGWTARPDAPGVLANVNYLADVFRPPHGLINHGCFVHVTDAVSPICIRRENRLAVVMPISGRGER